jgi:hypothetical protein
VTSVVLDHIRQECLERVKMANHVDIERPVGQRISHVLPWHVIHVLLDVCRRQVEEELALYDTSIVDQDSWGANLSHRYEHIT